MSKKEKKKHPQNIIIVAVAVLGLALIIGNLGDDDTSDASKSGGMEYRDERE